MNAKAQILANIRQHPLPDSPLPELNDDWIRFPDREARFLETLRSVGGQAEALAGRAELETAIRRLEAVCHAENIVCTVPELLLGSDELDLVDDPHALAHIDLAITRGQFAVAENGAVWVTDRDLRQRAILFITQHLVVVVPRSEIVDTMHQAYGRIRFEGPGYGVFISGPSKTADIEQSLVIGAHGPRSMTVLLTP